MAGSISTSAKADTVIPMPGSVAYLTQTVPDTLNGNGYLFVAANGEIIVTDLAGKQVATIDSGDGLNGLALAPDGATLYASVDSGAHAGSVAAITVSSIANGPLGQVFYPLTAGDQPGSLAVQSGKVWVSYSTTVDTVTTVQIGAIDLAADGAFAPAAAPGSWTSSVQLAADPQDTGVLVAVADQAAALTATYNTTAATATALAAQADLGSGGNACGYPGEVAVAPGGQWFAAACDGPGSVYAYSPADLATGVASYNAYGGSTSQAIAVAVDADGTVAVANRTKIYVYKPDGTLLNTLAITAGSKIDEAYGLAWVDAAGGPDLAAIYQSTTTKAYTVDVFDKAELPRPTVTFTATAQTSFGQPVKLSGTARLPGGAADTAKVTITRSGPGGTVALPAVIPSTAGAFTLTDTPKAAGTYTYKASTGATSVTATAKVTANVPALTLTPGNSAVAYKTVLHVTATLGKTYANRSLTIYAEVDGSGKDKVIASGKVNTKGQLAVAYTALQSTTFQVTYAGDAGDAAAHRSAVVAVRALVRQALRGQYGTRKSGGTTYLLYHHTGELTVAAVVTPGHPGECVKAETQEFYKGSWHASSTTACAKLTASSTKTLSLTLSKSQLGYPYRVRIDYVSSSPQNASNSSGWQYYLVEK
jgi:hypothetical protein